MRLYYRTNASTAQDIITEGFPVNETESIYLTELTGIWLTDIVFNVNEDLSDMKVLAIDIDLSEDELESYEVTAYSTPYKEYLFPVKVINDKGFMQIMKEKAEKEVAYLDYLDISLMEEV